jgi:hypothetical protein
MQNEARTQASESEIQARIMVTLSIPGLRVFRINVGRAWTGSEAIRLKNGDMLIKNPRPFKTGVPKGFSDLVGIKSVKITESMIGKTLGVFTAIEVKSPKGKTSAHQVRFLDLIRSLGGICGVARSEKQALEIVRGRDESK